MWESDHKEDWAPKNWCFWVVVPEKTLERPFDREQIKPINLKGSNLNIHWRTDAKAEALIIWPPDAKNQLIGKVPDAGKEWRQEEKWVTEDKMVGWHHQFNDMSLSRLWETVKKLREAWCAVVHGVAKNWTWLGNWIATTNYIFYH